MLIKKFVEGVTFRIDYILNVFSRGELNILAGLRLYLHVIPTESLNRIKGEELKNHKRDKNNISFDPRSERFLRVGFRYVSQ